MSFFFLTTGMGRPSAASGLGDSLELFAAEVAAEIAGLATREAIRLFGLLDLGVSSKASSMMATLPLSVRTPPSTDQISGQSAPTNSWLCEIQS